MTDKEEKRKHLVRIRAAHRGGATKLTGKLDSLLLKAESTQLSANDKEELANIKKTLEMKMKHLALYDQQIEELIEDEDDLDQEVDNCLEQTQRYVGYLEKIKNLEAPPLPSPTHTPIMTPSPVSSSTSRQFNLPKLEPPTFNGEYMQWTSYWDLFDASVHKNTSLTNAQKLQYLKRSLKVESASKLISHLSVTDANYDTARKMLETRYSNKRLIVRSHIQAMMSFPPLTQESAEGIRQLLECFQENTQALNTHTSQVAHWDTILVWAISEKLDSETRKWLELAHPGKNLQLLEDVMKFLDERSRALEAQYTSSSQGVLPSQTTDITNQQTKSTKLQLKSGPWKDSVSVSTKYGKGQQQKAYHSSSGNCNCCGEIHLIYHCPSYSEMNYDDRIAVIKKKKLCFNCLRANHSTKDCTSQSTCRKCNGKHHTTIHREQKASKSSNPALEEASEADQASYALAGLPQQSQVVLATIVLPIKTPTGKEILCRAFLDSGSQVSFITESCVQLLGLPKKRTEMTITGIANSGSTLSNHSVDVTIGRNSSIQFSASVLSKLTKDLPNGLIDTTKLTRTKNVSFKNQFKY